ncbi:MAG: phosphate ABC transporter permease PstA [Acidobacteria bacterium]|nr:MAG: phosphate ABC transporter permease PstA [Acidobacteriota bacterium]
MHFLSGEGDPRQEARRLLDRLAGRGRQLRLVVRGSGRRLALAGVEHLDDATELAAVAEIDGGAQAAWEGFRRHHDAVRQRWRRRRALEKHDVGEVNHALERARLERRAAELERERAAARHGAGSAAYEAAQRAYEAAQRAYEAKRVEAEAELSRIRAEIERINGENRRLQLLMTTAGEGATPPQTVLVPLDQIVRAYPANQLSAGGKAGVYLARWGEFLLDEPREANSEGGVFPAIFGTVTMTLLMSLAVVPFGVLAALYLREYARAGAVISAVRIAINNLAGVPSIVFGVFGLGFFCYVVGASLDQLLFAASLPNPTYGKGGLLWASLTLALLTLPVVIVATEEAVAAVPSSMREGSYACGASKWQTIRRIVLPRAMPGIITGMVLAIARGAGEVAPLMLVGAVKLAPELPIDGIFPYVHPERSFMHLGFHIYDVGFQSQNSEAAKPMVFTTTLLLIAIIALLNLTTIWLRGRLRKRYAGSQF